MGNFLGAAGLTRVWNKIAATYLKLSGGTMTGALTLKANQYSGLSGYGMNANNSDIVGVNSIYTEDLADDMGEGIHFFRSSGYWDSLTSSNGVLYYYPNRPTATTAFANAYTIYHSGNFNPGNYLPLSGGTLRAATGNFFSLNATAGTNCWQYFRVGGTDKASVGYYGGLAFVANEATYARIGVNNSGTPQYWDNSAGGSGHEFTIYHSGNANKSDVAWACSVLGCGESIHMGNGKQANLDTEGWYRVWTSNGAAEGSVIIRLTHNYWYNYSDGVILAISFDYGHATITQLAGSTYGSEIYSVRFSGDAGTRYIDFYYNANSINSVWVSTIGVGVSQVPTAVSSSETISNSTEWVVQDNAFGTSGDALIKNTLRVEGVIFGYHYTKHHDWAAFVFDKPGSYCTGIGPNGSANTIHFGPCGQTGEWVTELYQTWDFFGNIYAAGAITAGSASDKRLKKNIEALDINDAKNIIVNSRAVRFKWTDKATELSDQLKGDDIGLIAQEVESLVPSAISSIFNNYLRLDYTKFIAPIIRVEQDLLERVERLEKENEELKQQLKN